MLNVNEMTVGVEMETKIPYTSEITVGGYHHGKKVESLPTFNGKHWQATHDASISVNRYTEKACEFVSPVLKGGEAVKNACEVARKLKEMGATVNQSCGFHVHIGVPFATPMKDLNRLYFMVSRYEEAFFGASGTLHRERGGYCKKIKGRVDMKAMTKTANIGDLRFRDDTYDRYSILNINNLIKGDKPTVEFRVFGGTTDDVKVAAYIRLCMAIAQYASTLKGTVWGEKAPSLKGHGTGFARAYMVRLFKILGWNGKNPMGVVEMEGVPTLAECKAELLRLCEKYDTEREVSLTMAGM